MKTINFKIFKDYLKLDWYIQGFPAVPLFLSVAAESGISMEEELGFCYSHFLFNYYDNYGEMAYDCVDLERIWIIVKEKLQNNPKYLEEVKSSYRSNLRKYEPFLDIVKKNKLKNLDDEDLLNIFQKLVLAQRDGVGSSHIIDAIGIEIEKEFHQALKEELPLVGAVEFNDIFTTLITPSEISFVNREEQELMQIGNVDNINLLNRHAKRYSWINNSYAGPKYLQIDDFRDRLINIKKKKEKNNCSKTPDLISKHNLSPSLKEMIHIIDYCAVWQDERKALCYQNISYVGLVLDEIARRLNQSVNDFYYLGPYEALKLQSLKNLDDMIPVLRERKDGCLMIVEKGFDKLISGEEYKKIMGNNKSLLRNENTDNQELRGTVANIGTARGVVKILRNIESLNEFKEGDVLVASMTRPEFMPAIKKAVAIITDEGGVTCHAAIIARELNIPTIIGTKTATQILENGWMVEVRANHGVIKILEKT